MPHKPRSLAELATRLFIALGSFAVYAALVYGDVYLGLDVNWWLYALDIAIIGAMVGRDILKEYGPNLTISPGDGGGKQ